jgi:hypothetical protein
VEGAANIWVLPRAVPDDRTAPIVVHLLNRDYDAQKRDLVTKGPFKVLLDKALLGGRNFTRARLYQPRLVETFPGDEQVKMVTPVAVSCQGEFIELAVPSLHLWGVAEMTP